MKRTILPAVSLLLISVYSLNIHSESLLAPQSDTDALILSGSLGTEYSKVLDELQTIISSTRRYEKTLCGQALGWRDKLIKNAKNSSGFYREIDIQKDINSAKAFINLYETRILRGHLYEIARINDTFSLTAKRLEAKVENTAKSLQNLDEIKKISVLFALDVYCKRTTERNNGWTHSPAYYEALNQEIEVKNTKPSNSNFNSIIENAIKFLKKPSAYIQAKKETAAKISIQNNHSTTKSL